MNQINAIASISFGKVTTPNIKFSSSRISPANIRFGDHRYHREYSKGLIDNLMALAMDRSSGWSRVPFLRRLPGNPNAIIPFTYGLTPLMNCALWNDVHSIGWLLRRGADPDRQSIDTPRGRTALMYAVTEAHPKAVQALLAGKAKTTLKDFEGQTALILALGRGESRTRDEDILKNYTAYKADRMKTALALIHVATKDEVNQPSHYGYTPLMLAALNGEPRVVEALINKGADPTITTQKGLTALIEAVRSQHPQNVTLILTALKKKGVVQDHINSRDMESENGATALMYAVNGGLVSAVKALISAGADPTIPTKQYSRFGNDPITPLELAKRRMGEIKDPAKKAGFIEIMNLIQN